MRGFLHLYLENKKQRPEWSGNWGHAANVATLAACGKPHYANKLKEWTREYIKDGSLPVHNHGGGVISAIDDEDLAQDIMSHLQSIGKYVKAEDIVIFCGTPEMLTKLGRTKTISLATARRWMNKMGYRWRKTLKGQYFDGHERDDVIRYRQEKFLPQMAEYFEHMRCWLEDSGWDIPPGIVRVVVVWFHDESTFYQNDRRQTCWIPPGSSATPYTKGEGSSLMVA
ncbi:hypothetical protein BC826DRAFT_918689, partial [Russula brevipes]